MLTDAQEQQIAHLSDSLKVHITPFDPRLREEGMRLLSDLSIALPQAAVHYIGASKIGVAGQDEIDIIVIAHERFSEYAGTLKDLFGEPMRVSNDACRFSLSRHSHRIDVLLSTEETSQIQDYFDTQKVLEARGDLRSELDHLKRSCDGVSLREYTRKKYEFFNKILHPHGLPQEQHTA